MMLPSWDPRLSLSKFQSLQSSRLTHETLAEAESGNFLKIPQYMSPIFLFPLLQHSVYCWPVARKFYDVAVALRKTSAMQCKLLDNLSSRKAKFRRASATTLNDQKMLSPIP